MASLREVAERLRVAEEPLRETYEELRGAAATRVELDLCAQLLEAQRSQMACLTLLSDDLPPEIVAFGSICSPQTKMREGPGGSHPVIADLGLGTPLVIMSWSGYWAHVQLPGGRRGYVFRDYVATSGGGHDVPSWQRMG